MVVQARVVHCELVAITLYLVVEQMQLTSVAESEKLWQRMVFLTISVLITVLIVTYCIAPMQNEKNSDFCCILSMLRLGDIRKKKKKKKTPDDKL